MAKKTRKTEPAQPKRKATRKAKATLTVSREIEISGRVKDKANASVENLTVEVWHKKDWVNIPPSNTIMIHSAKTSAQGVFSFRITDDDFERLNLPPKLNIFFTVLQGSKPIKSTEDSPLRGVDSDVRDIVIEVDLPGERQFFIIGQVTDIQHPDRVGGLRLEALADRNGIPHSFGSDVTTAPGTTAPGSFHIQFSETYLRERFPDPEWPEFYFKAFCKNLEIPKIDRLEISRPSETVIEAKIRLIVPDECGSGNGMFKVSGVVRDRDCKPASGLTVRAFDKDLRSEQPLGLPATTDKNGHYEITYSSTDFSADEQGSADLIVRAYLPGEVIPSAESPIIIYDAKKEETIDLVIGGKCRGPSEYDLLIAEITPLLDGLTSPADLVENTEHQDITFLSNETGQDRQRINFLAVAYRSKNQTGQPAEAFYGFFRKGLPTDLPALLANSRETLRSALEAAIEENIIPARLKDEVENILNHLQDLDVEQPVFLVNPAVLFGNLNDLRSLPPAQAGYITAKLNEQFHVEILNAIGTVSDAMTRAAQTAVAIIDYQNFKGVDLFTVIKQGILAGVKMDKNLAQEAADVEARLAGLPSAKVSDALHLNAPLRNNPIFVADLRRAITAEFSQLAGVGQQAAKKLVQKNLLFDDIDDKTLSDLVKDGVITDQQKVGMRFTIDLAKLSGDNVALMTILKTEGMNSVADFVSKTKSDWQRLITDKKLPLPPGDTAETYAENILFNIELTYPTQSLIERLLSIQTTQVDLLDSVNSLLDNNDKLIDGVNPATIDQKGIKAAQRKNLQQNLQELTAFANTYCHLGVADIINNKTLNLSQKKRAIVGNLQLLGTFYQNNKQADLRLVNFFDAEGGDVNWHNIPAESRPLLRKQLMSYQRTLTLADSTLDRQTLLGKGYESAQAITGVTKTEFVSTSGLPLGQSRMIYARSQEYALTTSHNYATIRDTFWGNFDDFDVSNTDPLLVNDLRKIDGFGDLFGPQDFCDCEQCRSILSPAAYFVDLMHFIEQHVSKPVFINPNKQNHPLYLKNRRGDLWKLRLTCENTHTLIPYLTIVDEVLENYLKTVVSGDIFEKLSDPSEKISFGLPFNLPLEELRLYLSHFGITLHDIYRILKQAEAKVWRAKINLSKDEFGVITTPDPTGVKFRFGNPASFTDFEVQDFIRLAGITRQQLDELLALRFNPDLQNITVAKKSLADELQNFPEILKNLTNDRRDFIHRFIRLWRKIPWSITELDLVLTALKDATLIGTDVSPDAVLYLAQLKDIQDKLKLNVEELCPLVHQLPVSREFPLPPPKQADLRLYERLFDLKKLFGEKDPVTHELNTSVTFHHYSLNKNNPNDKEIDPKTPLLLGGLGISETELLLLFDLLKNEMPFDSNGDTTLDRRRISLLYRHARLAKALKLHPLSAQGLCQRTFSDSSSRIIEFVVVVGVKVQGVSDRVPQCYEYL